MSLTPPDDTWTLSRRIFAMAWPNILYAVLDRGIVLVDAWLVGRVGSAAVGAVGLSSRVMILVAVISMALSVGATPFIGQAFGAKDFARVRHTAVQTLRAMVAVGLILSPVLYLIARPSLRALQATGIIENYGTAYLETMALGLTFLFLNFCLLAFFRAAGQVKTPLLLMVLMNAANIPISWLLIRGWEPYFPSLGVRGAAWGTIISRAFGAALGLIIWLHRTRHYERVKRAFLDWPLLRQVLGVGLPVAGTGLVRMGAAMVFFALFAGLGELPLAAASIASSVQMMLIMPALMIRTALQTLVSHSLGAGRFEQARRYTWQTQLWGGLLMGSVTLALMIFAGPVVVLICSRNPEETEALRELTVAMLRISLFGCFFSTCAIIFGGALIGGGDVRWPFVFTVISQWLVMLPGAFAIRYLTQLPAPYIWWACVLSPAVLVVMSYWRFRQGKWQKQL